MTAILLAAGVGSRLRPLTNDRPKCLLTVGGTPLLERTCSALVHAGIHDCVLVTGYRSAMIERAVASFHLPLKVQFVHNAEFETTNNNFSLWLAGRELAGQGWIMMDADILFDWRLLTRLAGDPHPDALIMRADRATGAEEIKVEMRGEFVGRIGKDIPPAVAAGESIGIEKFSAATAGALMAILERRKVHNEFYEASFQELIDGGATIATVLSDGLSCMEIDTPQDLEAADRLARTMTP